MDTVCSLTIPYAAGGAGAPREHSGIHYTTVAPILPKIHSRKRA